MPARYVKPYVQRGKSDALDAEAICEAVGRPTMRFATIKTTEHAHVHFGGSCPAPVADSIALRGLGGED